MRLKINKVIALILMMSILGQPLFFTTMGLLGNEYEGAESSTVFVMYIVLLASLSFIVYFYSVLKVGITKKEIYILVFLLLFIVMHFLWVIFDLSETTLLQESFILFLLLGLPGATSAMTMIKLKLTRDSIRIMEPLLIVIVLGIIFYAVLPSLSGIRTTSLAGASYQSLSYYSAFSSGVLFTYATKIPQNFRFKWTSFFLYKAFLYVLVLCGVLGTVLGGGRGAFLLLLSYIIINVFTFIYSKSWLSSRNSLLMSMLKVLLTIILFGGFVSSFWEREFIQSGFKRATMFISSDGSIDLESGSSGRDIVYSEAARYIDQHPILGYGPFGALDNTIQAHNIFLDIALQFGYVGLIICIVLAISLVIRAIRNWTLQSTWVFAIFLYPLVLLMFSGYYLHTAIFLFGIAFFVMHNKMKSTYR